MALDCPDRPGRVVVHLKGAPEVVINMCKTKVQGRNDPELGADEKADIMAKVEEMCKNRLRVLAFACFEMDSDVWQNRFEKKGGSTNIEFEDAL